jgi:hypothetical protein
MNNNVKRLNILTMLISLAMLEACDNAPPVLADIETEPLSYTEDQAATEITATLTVTDSDDNKLSGATIEISSNYQDSEDELAYNDNLPTTITVNTNNGILSLSGSADLSDYQTALRAITYRNTNTSTPNTSTRTVSFTVSDETNNSNSVSRAIIVKTANDAPILDNTKDKDGKTNALKLDVVTEDASQ